MRSDRRIRANELAGKPAPAKAAVAIIKALCPPVLIEGEALLKIVIVLMLALVSDGVKGARGQVGVDESRAGWQLGSHRGAVHL